MAKEKIIFDIFPQGMKIETSGYKGDGCLKELEKFRRFMKDTYGVDLDVTSTQKTPEYFNQNNESTKNRERV